MRQQDEYPPHHAKLAGPVRYCETRLETLLPGDDRFISLWAPALLYCRVLLWWLSYIVIPSDPVSTRRPRSCVSGKTGTDPTPFRFPSFMHVWKMKRALTIEAGQANMCLFGPAVGELWYNAGHEAVDWQMQWLAAPECVFRRRLCHRRVTEHDQGQTKYLLLSQSRCSARGCDFFFSSLKCRPPTL